MTRMNKIGNEIKKLQKIEKRRDLEHHCNRLNHEKNPKKFFETFSIISNPLLGKSSKKAAMHPIQDEMGNVALSGEEKSTLFANRLQRLHKEPVFEGFDENWKKTVDHFIADNEILYTMYSH